MIGKVINITLDQIYRDLFPQSGTWYVPLRAATRIRDSDMRLGYAEVYKAASLMTPNVVHQPEIFVRIYIYL